MPKQHSGIWTCMIALPSAMFRDAMRRALTESFGAEIISEAASFDQVAEMLPSKQPNMLLLSTDLPGMLDPVVPESLAPMLGYTQLVLFVREDTPIQRSHEFLAVLKPKAVIGRDIHLEDLLAVLKLVRSGMVVWPAKATIDGLRGPLLKDSRFSGHLSPREQHLLEALARGDSEKEAALRLGIGVRTVQTYLDRIKRKLGAVSRVHAVAIALDAGLISMGTHDGEAAT